MPDGRQLNWLYYGSGHLHQIRLDGQVISDIERDALHRETLRTQGALHSRYGYDALGRLTAQAAWRMAPAAPPGQGQTGITPRPGAWAALGDDIEPHTATASQGSAILGRRYQYDPAGNLRGIDDLRNGTTRYGYDRIGRILSSIQPNLAERFAFDPAHNLLPVAGTGQDTTTPSASQGLIRNNRLEVFEDQRYRYDTHGNLTEKRIGKHTLIQLEWDVEHQLQKATVTRAAHSDSPVTTETRYRYDAFGRRLQKQDQFGSTLFEWDGNRLLSEQRGSNHRLYIYEADSFAPLAQVQLNGKEGTDNSKPKQALALASQAPAAIKIELPDDDEGEWQPRKTAAAFAQQMRALQLQTMARVRGQFESEEPADFDDTLPLDFDDTLPPEEPDQPGSHKVVRLKDWRVRYYHNDHLGTPRELSDEDGSIVWQATYRAWGNTLTEEWLPEQAPAQKARTTPPQQARQENLSQNLRFQGQYFDEETGLHYNRFRYYDPDCGRFISQDPIGLHGSVNFYHYAPNPVIWVDPWGLAPIAHLRNGRTLCIKDKFPSNSAESRELNDFVNRWNQQIKNNGGSMTRRVLSEEEQKDSDNWRKRTRCQCPDGKVAGHVPDAAAGGPAVPLDWMPQSPATNGYIAGIVRNLPVGYVYDNVKLVTSLADC